METVEQIDLFDYMQLFEEQELVALSSIDEITSIPSNCSVQKIGWFLQKLCAVWKWILGAACNLFGIARWVNVYAVSRAFGGREDGGWYYLKHECLNSRQVGFWEADALRMKWNQEYSSLSWGDVRKKSGGLQIIVLIEWRKAASRTKGVPCYWEYANEAIPFTLVQGTI